MATRFDKPLPVRLSKGGVLFPSHIALVWIRPQVAVWSPEAIYPGHMAPKIPKLGSNDVVQMFINMAQGKR